MENNEALKSAESVSFTEKLFGGIKMTWWKVTIFAAVTAAFTALMMLLPFTKDTSFREISSGVECWVLFAIIIMTNCEKPLESALKTFAFFAMSQVLIFLFQVPFSEMGLELLGNIPHRLLLSLFTFPMAFAGWYLKKKNWLSFAILLPMLLLLSFYGAAFVKDMTDHFPCHLISVIVCFGQIFLYIYVFFDDKIKQLIALVLSVAVTAVVLVFTGLTDITMEYPLPDAPELSDSASAAVKDAAVCTAQLFRYENSDDVYVSLHFINYGDTEMYITDGSNIYQYSISLEKTDDDPYLLTIERTDNK